MPTHCVVTVKDADGATFSIYRHYDGYPEGEHGVIAALARVLPLAWPLPRFEAADFAAAIVAAWKEPGGGGIYLTTGVEANGDLAFHYVVTQNPHSPRVLDVEVLKAQYGNDSEAWSWVQFPPAHIPPLGPLGRDALRFSKQVE